METEVDQNVIQTTKETLGKHVKRPPLTDKLLRKPPFRFLHDIVTTVLKTTGFFEGLFEEDELLSENIKDREAKINFLTKVIGVINFATGNNLTVKPSKVVAGQEPEKTNELLQCLGLALQNNISSHEAVKKIKETTTNPPKKSESDKKLKPSKPNAIASKSSESISNKKSPHEKIKPVKLTREASISRKATKEAPDPRDRSTTRKSTRDISKTRKDAKDSPKTKADQLITEKSTKKEEDVKRPKLERRGSKLSSKLISQSSEEKPQINNSEDKKEKLEPQENPESERLQKEIISIDNNDSPKENPLDAFLSSDESPAENETHFNHKSDIEEIKTIQLPPISNHIDVNVETEPSHPEVKQEVISDNIEEKPKTKILTKTVFKEINTSIDEAFPITKPSITTISKPPLDRKDSDEKSKVHTNHPVSSPPPLRPPTARPPSSRPGAPRLREKHDDFLANSDLTPVGKVNIIVESTDHEEEDASLVVVESQMDTSDEASRSEAMRHGSADRGHLVQQILESQKEFSQSISGKTEIEWEFGALRAREASSQEIEQMKVSLQALSRAANPLGKMLDHIQEDVEVMRHESLQWKTAFENASTELIKQKAANEESLVPLHAKIKQLDLDLEEKREKINDLKTIIYKNASRIEKLLTCGDVQ